MLSVVWTVCVLPPATICPMAPKYCVVVGVTLLVEISVNNPTGQLFTGAYAEVHMKLPVAASSFTLPVNTLLFRSEGLRLAVVGQGNKVELRPIQIGHDFGSEVEIIAGLNGNESVIINPPDSIVSGEAVRVGQASTQTTGASQ